MEKGPNKTKNTKIHQVQISPDDIQKHKKSIVNLKNPLWNEFDY